MAGAPGMLNQLGIDSSSPVTKRFDFLSCSLRATSIPIDGNGLRGTLSHDISRARTNLYRVNGGLELEPNRVELQLLLPWILGTDVSGTTYALADTTQTRYVALDYANGANLRTFAGVAVNRCTITASQGTPLRMSLDLVGQTETVSGSFPVLSIDTANGPFVFTDSASGLTMGASTITPKSMSITIDNHIDPDRFFNSLTLVSTVKHDRTITVGVDLPDGDFDSLYSQAVTGVNTVFVFTNGATALTFTMGKVCYTREGPTSPGRSEVMLPISGLALANGATKELVTTLT